VAPDRSSVTHYTISAGSTASRLGRAYQVKGPGFRSEGYEFSRPESSLR